MLNRRGLILGLGLMAAGALAACGSPPPSLDEMPEGTPVTVTTQEGGVASGELAGVDENTVTLTSADGGATVVERDAITEVATEDDAPAPVEVTVPASTAIAVELNTTVASNASRQGDPVEATLTAPLEVDGRIVAPAGSELLGRVTAVEASGRVRGRAMLEVRFDRLRAGSVTHEIDTDPIRYVADSTRSDDARTVGIGAGLGALVGAIADGGQGAAVGAAIGAGGGTAVVLSTPGDEVNLGAGTPLEARLAQPFTATVAAE